MCACAGCGWSGTSWTACRHAVAVAGPVLLIAAAASPGLSPGPAFYTQIRVGGAAPLHHVQAPLDVHRCGRTARPSCAGGGCNKVLFKDRIPASRGWDTSCLLPRMRAPQLFNVVARGHGLCIYCPRRSRIRLGPVAISPGQADRPVGLGALRPVLGLDGRPGPAHVENRGAPPARREIANTLKAVVGDEPTDAHQRTRWLRHAPHRASQHSHVRCRPVTTASSWASPPTCPLERMKRTSAHRSIPSALAWSAPCGWSTQSYRISIRTSAWPGAGPPSTSCSRRRGGTGKTAGADRGGGRTGGLSAYTPPLNDAAPCTRSGDRRAPPCRTGGDRAHPAALRQSPRFPCDAPSAVHRARHPGLLHARSRGLDARGASQADVRELNDGGVWVAAPPQRRVLNYPTPPGRRRHPAPPPTASTSPRVRTMSWSPTRPPRPSPQWTPTVSLSRGAPLTSGVTVNDRVISIAPSREPCARPRSTPSARCRLRRSSRTPGGGGGRRHRRLRPRRIHQDRHDTTVPLSFRRLGQAQDESAALTAGTDIAVTAVGPNRAVVLERGTGDPCPAGRPSTWANQG